MSRHRGLKNLIDDYDESEDFDPMESDESSPDFYITQVIEKTGALPKKKVLNALNAVDWDIQAAIKLLKGQNSVKPTPQPATRTQGKTIPTPAQKLPVLSNTSSISSTKSPSIIQKKDSTSSYASSKSSQIEEKKQPVLNLVLMNQIYPDVNSEV